MAKFKPVILFLLIDFKNSKFSSSTAQLPPTLIRSYTSADPASTLIEISFICGSTGLVSNCFLINNPLVLAAERNPNAVNQDALFNLIRGYGEEQANALGIPKEQADQIIKPYLDQTKNPANLRQFLKEKLFKF